MFLRAIHEKVPVFSGEFTISQDVTVSTDPSFTKELRSAGTSGKTITVKGVLFYQACDQVKCFLPDKVPVSWQLQALPLDGKRSPEGIRHPGDP
jgi:hypothetical protein